MFVRLVIRFVVARGQMAREQNNERFPPAGR